MLSLFSYYVNWYFYYYFTLYFYDLFLRYFSSCLCYTQIIYFTTVYLAICISLVIPALSTNLCVTLSYIVKLIPSFTCL